MAEGTHFDNCENVVETNDSEERRQFQPSEKRDEHIEQAFLEYVQQMVGRFRQHEIDLENENAAIAIENDSDSEWVENEGSPGTETNRQDALIVAPVERSEENQIQEIQSQTQTQSQTQIQTQNADGIAVGEDDVHENVQNTEDPRPI